VKDSRTGVLATWLCRQAVRPGRPLATVRPGSKPVTLAATRRGLCQMRTCVTLQLSIMVPAKGLWMESRSSWLGRPATMEFESSVVKQTSAASHPHCIKPDAAWTPAPALPTAQMTKCLRRSDCCQHVQLLVSSHLLSQLPQ
jgi:hypothetical protein